MENLPVVRELVLSVPLGSVCLGWPSNARFRLSRRCYVCSETSQMTSAMMKRIVQWMQRIAGICKKCSGAAAKQLNHLDVFDRLQRMDGSTLQISHLLGRNLVQTAKKSPAGTTASFKPRKFNAR